MRVLVLHSLPDSFMRYGEGIDHLRHDVTYLTTAARVATLPRGVRARTVVRADATDRASAMLAAVQGEPTPDLVVTLSEFDLLAAAQLREEFGIRGARTRDVLPSRDKVLMKSIVQRAGLRAPRFAPLAEALRTNGQYLPWRGKSVLKPVSGASSKETYVFATVAALLEAVRTQHVAMSDDDFEVEEFISGPVLHIDGLLAEHRPVVVQASRYVGDCLAYAQGDPLGSVQIETGSDLSDWALRCLRAIGIADGPFHLEAIQSPEGLVFLEVGARCGSIGVVEAFELATGVHLPSAAVRLALDGAGSAPAPRIPRSDQRFGWFTLPGHTLGSRYCRLSGEGPFRHSPLVHRWHQLTPDQPVKTSVTYGLGFVPVGALLGPASTSELEGFLRRLFTSVHVHPAGPPAWDYRGRAGGGAE